MSDDPGTAESGERYRIERELSRGVDAGPFLIVARVEVQDRPSPGGYRAYSFDIVESAIRFRRDLVDRGLVPPIWAV